MISHVLKAYRNFQMFLFTFCIFLLQDFGEFMKENRLTPISPNPAIDEVLPIERGMSPQNSIWLLLHFILLFSEGKFWIVSLLEHIMQFTCLSHRLPMTEILSTFYFNQLKGLFYIFVDFLHLFFVTFSQWVKLEIWTSFLVKIIA